MRLEFETKQIRKKRAMSLELNNFMRVIETKQLKKLGLEFGTKKTCFESESRHFVTMEIEKDSSSHFYNLIAII